VMGLVRNLFSKFQDKREELNLSSFGDELAFKTSWDPLVLGGPNFCTQKLHKSTSPVSGYIVRFKITFGAMISSATLTLVGLGGLFTSIPAGNLELIFPSLFLAGAGAYLCWMMQKSESVFDRSSRRLAMDGKTYNLDQVCAIQLIREHVSGARGGKYYSYELNLICAGGERINVVDHGSLRVIREDAEVLANYLSIPVWDAIDFRIPEQAAY